MSKNFKHLISLRNLSLLAFAAYSLNFSTGLGGCDQGTTAADTTETTEGDPVDVGGGTTPGENPTNPSTNTPPENPPTENPPTVAPGAVKSVILVIGSGMGPQQVGQLVQYRRMRKPADEKLAIEKLMDKKIMGMMSTHSYLDMVSDSASASTSMACGLKARNNTVGLDANGNNCQTIFEKAIALTKATGIVSTAPVSHPNVSSFIAHHLNGEEQNAIAESLSTNLAIDVLFAGGGENLIPEIKGGSAALSWKSRAIAGLTLKADLVYQPRPDIGIFIPFPGGEEGPPTNAMYLADLPECSGIDENANSYSKRDDQKNLIEDMKAKGYQFVCKKDQLSGIEVSEATKVLGVFSSGHFPRSPERKNSSTVPSLAEMTGKALDILAAKNKGFVLVVHSSMTNLAAQENDPGTLLQEGLDYDAALKVAMDYAEAHTDTLLIVTSDHDTAGFSFAYSKQAGSELDLPSGGHYDQPYNYAPSIKLELLMEQQKSFHAMTRDILSKLYKETPDINLDEAGNLLVTEVQNNSKYKITQAQAKDVLWRPSGQDNAQTDDFAPFYVHDNIHNNLLGRVVSPQTSTVWAAGTATSTPVMVFATGPSAYADRVRGMIDNTEIGKIISDALSGR